MTYLIEKTDSLDVKDLMSLWDVASHSVLRNYPFHFWPALKTDEEKRDHFFQSFFHFLEKPDGIVWKSVLDDKIVAINAGTITDKMIHWELSIIGYDENGRRDWLSAEWATEVRNAFWKKCKVVGWKMKVVASPENTILRYYENNKEAEAGKGDAIEIVAPVNDKPYLPNLDSLREIDIVKKPKK